MTVRADRRPATVGDAPPSPPAPRWSLAEWQARHPGGRLGHTLALHPCCDSTQDEAMDLARAGADDGTLVLAHQQRAGRGRRGRCWLSEQGGLYLSLVLRPELATERLPRIPLLAAAGLLEGLRELGVDAHVKWPNDILCPAGGEGPLGPFRKVAGILAEPLLEGSRVQAVVLGLGINVGQPARGFPGELEARATALAAEGLHAPPDEILCALLPVLDRWLATPGCDDHFSAARRLLAQHSATLGRRVEAVDEGCAGIAESIDPSGALWIRDDQGTRHRILAGDVLPLRGSP